MNEAASTIRLKMKHPSSKTAYIALPGYPEEPEYGVVAKTIAIDDVISDYDGPQVNFDFDANGKMIGIEILA